MSFLSSIKKVIKKLMHKILSNFRDINNLIYPYKLVFDKNTRLLMF